MLFGELLTLVSSSYPRKIPVCADSRLVRPGDCFVAVRGEKFDAHTRIPEALEKGAAYIVTEQSILTDKAEVIRVADTRRALGVLAQAALRFPCNELVTLAVTGTNGKTTVGFLVHSIINAAGYTCGLLGTIVYDNGIKHSTASLTTPDSTLIARLCRELVDSGGKYLMMEASSHALQQRRLAGLRIDAAAFTNLTGDHLDYHGTEANYLAAKSLLFEELLPHAAAVLNRQSPVCMSIAEKTPARVLWYAVGEEADLRADIIDMEPNCTRYRMQFEGRSAEITTAMIGLHNVSNQLAAAGLCIAAGFELSDIVRGIEALKCVPGRLEPVECGQDFTVLVDYAHTDDALGNVLKTLRPLCRGRLILVFGCGGDRDRTKRPRMARIAQKYADRIIVTSDNPRTENPESIIDEILTGFDTGSRETITVEPDRRKAIETAIGAARPGDMVLIAGKGHETYQVIGEEYHDFSDIQTAQEILRGL